MADYFPDIPNADLARTVRQMEEERAARGELSIHNESPIGRLLAAIAQGEPLPEDLLEGLRNCARGLKRLEKSRPPLFAGIAKLFGREPPSLDVVELKRGVAELVEFFAELRAHQAPPQYLEGMARLIKYMSAGEAPPDEEKLLARMKEAGPWLIAKICEEQVTQLSELSADLAKAHASPEVRLRLSQAIDQINEEKRPFSNTLLQALIKEGVAAMAAATRTSPSTIDQPQLNLLTGYSMALAQTKAPEDLRRKIVEAITKVTYNKTPLTPPELEGLIAEAKDWLAFKADPKLAMEAVLFVSTPSTMPKKQQDLYIYASSIYLRLSGNSGPTHLREAAARVCVSTALFLPVTPDQEQKLSEALEWLTEKGIPLPPVPDETEAWITKETVPTKHKVYTLKGAEIVGHVSYNLSTGKSDLYLLDLAGITVLVVYENKKLVVHNVLDPSSEKMARIRELVLPPGKNEIVLTPREAELLGTAIQECEFIPREHPEIFDYLQIEFPPEEARSIEETLRQTKIYFFNDKTLMTRIGFDPEKLGTATVYSESADLTGLEFATLRALKAGQPEPADNADSDKWDTVLELKGAKIVHHISLKYPTATTEPSEIWILDMSGIHVIVMRSGDFDPPKLYPAIAQPQFVPQLLKLAEPSITLGLSNPVELGRVLQSISKWSVNPDTSGVSPDLLELVSDRLIFEPAKSALTLQQRLEGGTLMILGDHSDLASLGADIAKAERDGVLTTRKSQAGDAFMSAPRQQAPSPFEQVRSMILPDDMVSITLIKPTILGHIFLNPKEEHKTEVWLVDYSGIHVVLIFSKNGKGLQLTWHIVRPEEEQQIYALIPNPERKSTLRVKAKCDALLASIRACCVNYDANGNLLESPGEWSRMIKKRMEFKYPTGSGVVQNLVDGSAIHVKGNPTDFAALATHRGAFENSILRSLAARIDQPRLPLGPELRGKGDLEFDLIEDVRGVYTLEGGELLGHIAGYAEGIQKRRDLWLVQVAGVLVMVSTQGEKLEGGSFGIAYPWHAQNLRHLFESYSGRGIINNLDTLGKLNGAITRYVIAMGKKGKPGQLEDLVNNYTIIVPDNTAGTMEETVAKLKIHFLGSLKDFKLLGFDRALLGKTVFSYEAETQGHPFRALQDPAVARLYERPVAASSDPPDFEVPAVEDAPQEELRTGLVELFNPKISGAVYYQSAEGNTLYRLVHFGDFLFVLGLCEPKQILFHLIDMHQSPERLFPFFPPVQDQIRYLNSLEEREFNSLLRQVMKGRNHPDYKVVSPQCIGITEKGVPLQVDLGVFAETIHWGSVKLILPDGLESSRPLGLDFEKKTPVSVAQNPVIVAEKKLADGKSFYLVELSGLHMMYYFTRALGQKTGHFFIPPSLVNRARKMFQIQEEDFSQEILNLQNAVMESPLHLGTYVSFKDHRLEIFDDDQNFRIVLPPPLQGRSPETTIGRWRMEIFAESKRLDDLGYKREGPLTQGHSFQKVISDSEGNVLYHAGTLAVFHWKKDDALLVLNSPDTIFFVDAILTEKKLGIAMVEGGRLTVRKVDKPEAPVVTLTPTLIYFRKGTEFVPLEKLDRDRKTEMAAKYSGDFLSPLPDARITLSRLPDPFLGARIEWPLTPALTRRTGLSHEKIYPLVKVADHSRSGATVQVTSYSAGPLGVVQIHIPNERKNYFFVGPPNMMESGDLEFLTDLATNLRERGSVIAFGLYRSSMQAGLFVPSSVLGPVEVKRVAASFGLVLNDLLADNLQRDRVFDLRGIQLRYSPKGWVLIIQPTDFLTQTLLDVENAKKEGPAHFQKFRIAAPDGAKSPEITVVPSPLSVTVQKSLAPFSPQTPFVLETEGNRSSYTLTFPFTTVAQMKEGDKISISANGQTQEYRLQKRKGNVFHLYAGSEMMGDIKTQGERLLMTFGKDFRIEGEIPKRDQIESVMVEGIGGPLELAGYLDRLARRVGGEPHGYDDALRKISEALLLHNNFDFAGGVEEILSVYQAKIILSAEGMTWKMTVHRKEETPHDVFLDFVEAAGEVNNSPPPPLRLRGGELDYHPYPDIPISLAFTGEDFSLAGSMDSRGPDARLKELTLSWNGHGIPLDVTGKEWPWGLIMEEEGKLEWVPENEVRFQFSVILSPTGEESPGGSFADAQDDKRGVQVTRDFLVTFSRTGIVKVNWVEHRVYSLESGEKIEVNFKNGEWKWGEVIDIIDEGRSAQRAPFGAGSPLQRKHYKLTLNQVPQAGDITPNLAKVDQLDLPHGAGKVRIVWEWAPGDVQLYSIDLEQNGKWRNLAKGPLSWRQGFTQSYKIKWNLSPFGEVEDAVTVNGLGGAWEVKSDLEFGESAEGLKWVGRKTEDGFDLQQAVYEGRRAEGLPRVITEGASVLVSLRGASATKQSQERPDGVLNDGLVEFLITCENHQLNTLRLTLPEIPAGFVMLGEDEISLSPRLFAEGVDLRPRFGNDQPLPFGIDEVRRHYTADLTKLLAEIGENEVFYPTLGSLNTMMEAVRVKSSRPVLLQFVSSSSTLVFEQSFLYTPDEIIKWKLVEGEPHFNGQERPTLHQSVNAATHQWVPVPPGTTRLQSVLMAGGAGFFCLINATGTTPTQLMRRRQKAVEGFQRYLYANSAGLLENAPSRFAAKPEWSVDPWGQARCRLVEEILGKSGTQTTEKWISFSARLNAPHTAVTFEKGRTEITLGEGGQTFFHGLFQGISQAGSNRVTFVQLGTPAGKTPRVFRATFLPGADPLFVEIPYKNLFDRIVNNHWLNAEGWVQPFATKLAPVDPERSKKQRDRYVLEDTAGKGLAGRPFDIQGDLPEAGADLLPYLINEQDWKEMRTIRNGEITEEQVRWLDLWLARGGSDFQLLPESVIELRRAQAELAKIPREEWKEKIPKIHPLQLWLMNGNGVRLQISLVPHVPLRGAMTKPSWVFHPDGARNQGVAVRFVGKNPETGEWVQIYTPVTYDRKAQDQQIKIFDPVGLSGVLQTLKWVGFQNLFALYDATHRPEPEDESRANILQWATPHKRHRVALGRLIRLSGLIEEAEEKFVLADGEKPEEILDGEQLAYRWTLREFEKGGNSGLTGKQVRIAYSLPHTTEPGADSWSQIPLPFQKKIRVEVRNDLLDHENVWHEMELEIYRTRDEALLLVDPADPRKRYVLSFDGQVGREGWPVLRQVRGFESGLDDFYSPPQWNMTYHVQRVLSKEETTGLGRVQDVSAEYREALALPEDHHVYRYFFHVDEIYAETQFDLLIDAEGKIVKVLSDSWEIDGLKNELNRSLVKTEIDGTRIYLRHRSKAYAEAVGNTHSIVVDFKPDPETGNFLGRKVEVTNFYYRRISKDPRQLFFPSETGQQFGYRLGEGEGKVYPYGYLTSTALEASSASPVKINLIFYDEEQASKRREVELVLERDAAGNFSMVRPGSLRLFNYHTGEELAVSTHGELQVEREGEVTRFVLTHQPATIVFYLDRDGNLPKNLEKPFELRFMGARALQKAARTFASLRPELLARAESFFEQVNKPGADQPSWMEACLLFVSLNQDVEILTDEHLKTMARLAGEVFRRNHPADERFVRRSQEADEADASRTEWLLAQGAAPDEDEPVDTGALQERLRRFETAVGLQDWFTKYHLMAQSSAEPLGAFHQTDLLNTGFGLALIHGLKTFVDSADATDEGENRSLIEDFTKKLAEAALSVFKDKNEILARQLAELVLGGVLAEGVDWNVREEIMYSAFDGKIFKNPERLKAYHDYALVMPHVRKDFRERILRVLRRPNMGEAEKSLLDTLVEAHFKEDLTHPVWSWKRVHGVKTWLAPLAGKPPPKTGLVGGGGGGDTARITEGVSLAPEGGPFGAAPILQAGEPELQAAAQKPAIHVLPTHRFGVFLRPAVPGAFAGRSAIHINQHFAQLF